MIDECLILELKSVEKNIKGSCSTDFNLLKINTAVPLTARGMDWDPSTETVCRMEAASERTWTYLQCVSGDGSLFMSRIV